MKIIELVLYVFRVQKDKSLLLFVFMYFLVRILRLIPNSNIPDFILYNLTDFLCLPILLTVTHIIIQLLFPERLYKVSLLQIGLLALFYSVLFEFILPKYSLKYTSDPVDVIMYFLGGGYYWLYGKYVQVESH